jgi:MFS transporter, DHA2 family, multidrug resistance protein
MNSRSDVETLPSRTGEWSPSFNPWLIALAVMIATFMEVLDTSVANVSLPHIAGSLSASTDEATWVLTSYLVSNAIILPATSWLAGMFGRKQLLITCIIIFSLASALCGAAPSLNTLIIARVIQGAGGGALQPIAQSVLLESFPPEKRGQAMAVYGMGIIVAPIIGPTLGGWITDNYSWRWIFYINLPVGIAAIMMAQAFVENPPYLRRVSRAQIDYIGFGLMAVWLATMQLILDKGQEDDWFSAAWIRWLALVSVIALAGFVVRELVVKDPIVDLRVLSDRNFRTGCLLIAIVGAVLYSTTAVLPIFLQTLLGYPALQSGLAMSPRGLGSLASMIVVGRLIGRIDSRLLMAGGFTVLATSAFMLSNINLDISMGNIIAPNVINGLAMGFIFVPLTTTTMGTLANRQMGNASGIYNLMRNTGGSIGISIATTVLARLAQSHQNTLVGHVDPYNPIFQQQFRHLLRGFASTAGGPGAAQQAYGAIYGMVLRQSTLLAFVDNFRILGYVCLLCIPLAFVFRKVTARGGATAVH